MHEAACTRHVLDEPALQPSTTARKCWQRVQGVCVHHARPAAQNSTGQEPLTSQKRPAAGARLPKPRRNLCSFNLISKLAASLRSHRGDGVEKISHRARYTGVWYNTGRLAPLSQAAAAHELAPGVHVQAVDGFLAAAPIGRGRALVLVGRRHGNRQRLLACAGAGLGQQSGRLQRQ